MFNLLKGIWCQWRIQGVSVMQLPPQTSVVPPNAPLFYAHGSRNRDKKYSKINNVFRLVKRQDLRAVLYSTSYRIT